LPIRPTKGILAGVAAILPRKLQEASVTFHQYCRNAIL
jgi:hypothetical protein